MDGETGKSMEEEEETDVKTAERQCAKATATEWWKQAFRIACHRLSTEATDADRSAKVTRLHNARIDNDLHHTLRH